MNNGTDKLVSVILPTYNRGRVIGEAIQSVLNQTHGNFELIIIDDFSGDDTGQVVASFNDNRIRYIRKERGGVSRARNAALSLAAGDYIAFIDSDDVYLPKKLESQVAFLESRPDYAVAYSPYIEKFKGRETIHLCKHGNGNLFSKMFKKSFVNVNSILVRSEAAKSVGGFPEDYTTLEDFDFFLRLAEKYLWGYVPEVSSEYRMAERDPAGDTDNYLHYLNYVKNAPEKFATLKKHPSVHKWKYGKVLYGLGKSHFRAGRIEEAERVIAESLKYRWQPDAAMFLRKVRKKLSS